MSIGRLTIWCFGFWFLLNCVILAVVFGRIMYLTNVEDREVTINLPQVRPTIDEVLMSLQEGGSFKLTYNKKLDKCEIHSS